MGKGRFFDGLEGHLGGLWRELTVACELWGVVLVLVGEVRDPRNLGHHL